ncbi:MAG TPA: catalase family peroxidase [Candidatus Acidoferrum sp.]|jgi:catalase
MATPSAGLSGQNELYGQLVDALNTLFGVHPGFRATHAKGVICEGTFTPNVAAASLSRAPHFQGALTPVTVRFSDFTGIPNIPDNDPNANPRGMGIKFHVDGGAETDIVAHSFNGFPVGTAEEFLEFLRAVASSAPDAPKPSPVELFLSTRPRAAAFVTTPKPAPASFASQSYYSVNALKFTNAHGTSRYARYQIHPVDGEAHLNDAETAAKPANYLFDEIVERLAKAPAKFKLVAQLAAEGDKTQDASITWPDDRPRVELGVITVTKRAEDSDAIQRRLVFDPANLIDGIELSNDPLPAARSAVYSIAYQRRNAQS